MSTIEKVFFFLILSTVFLIQFNLFLFFFRRDKTLNYFSIMLRKRLKNSDGTEEVEEPDKKTKRKKSAKSLVLAYIHCFYISLRLD